MVLIRFIAFLEIVNHSLIPSLFEHDLGHSNESWLVVGI